MTRLLALPAIGLAITAASPSFAMLAAAVLLVGLTSAVAQIVVPLTASLADDQNRGR